MALKDLLKGIIKNKGDKSTPEAEQPSVLINGFPALQALAPTGDKNAGGMAGHPILGGGGDPPPSNANAPISSPGNTEDAMNFISTAPPAQQPPPAFNELPESPHPMSPGAQELSPPPLPTEPTASGMDWLSLGTTVTSTTSTEIPEASGEAPSEPSITLPPPSPDPAEPTMNLTEFINPPLSPEDPSGMFPSAPPPQEALASPALNLAEANLEQQAQDLLAHFNPAPQPETPPPVEEVPSALASSPEKTSETTPENTLDLQAANDLLSQFTQKKAAPPSLADATEEPPFELPASSEPLAQTEDLFSAFTQQAQPGALETTQEPAAAEAKSFSPDPGNSSMDEFLSQSLATPDPSLIESLETGFQLPEVAAPLQADPIPSSESDLLNDFLSGVTTPANSTPATEPALPQEPPPIMDLAAFNDLVTPQNLQQALPEPEPVQASAPDSRLTAMLDQASLLNESLPTPPTEEPKLESPSQEPPPVMDLAAFNDLVTPQNLQQEASEPEPSQSSAPDSPLTAEIDQVSRLNESLSNHPPEEPELKTPPVAPIEALNELPPKDMALTEVAALDSVQKEALLAPPLPESRQETTASSPPPEGSEIEAFMSFLETPAPTDTMAEIPETLLAEPSLEAVEAHVRENILHEPPAAQATREPKSTKKERSGPPQANMKEKAPKNPKAESATQETKPAKPAPKPKPPSQFPGESMAFGPPQKEDKAKQRPAQHKAPSATGKASELLEASHLVNNDINALVNSYFAEKKAELLALD